MRGDHSQTQLNTISVYASLVDHVDYTKCSCLIQDSILSPGVTAKDAGRSSHANTNRGHCEQSVSCGYYTEGSSRHSCININRMKYGGNEQKCNNKVSIPVANIFGLNLLLFKQ